MSEMESRPDRLDTPDRKYCRDCKYYCNFQGLFYFCSRFRDDIGTMLPCESVRDEECGREGKYFEKKQEKPEKHISEWTEGFLFGMIIMFTFLTPFIALAIVVYLH